MAVNWLAVLVYILQVATFYCDQDCQVGICNGQIPEIWSFLKWFGMKKLFGMYVIVWHFLAFFDGVGIKNVVSHFFKTSGSVTAVGFEFWKFCSGQVGLPFLPQSHPPRYKRLSRFPSKCRHRARDNPFLGKTSKTAAHCTVS